MLHSPRCIGGGRVVPELVGLGVTGWAPRRHMLRWGPEPPPPPSSTAALGLRETRSRTSSMGPAEAFGRGRHDDGHGGRRGKEATTAGGKGGGGGHDGTSYPWRHVWDRVAPVTDPLSPLPLPSILPSPLHSPLLPPPLRRRPPPWGPHILVFPLPALLSRGDGSWARSERSRTPPHSPGSSPPPPCSSASTTWGLERQLGHHRGPLLGPDGASIAREWRCGEEEEASEKEWVPRPPDTFVGRLGVTTKNMCLL
jgi:hypothetical protein